MANYIPRQDAAAGKKETDRLELESADQLPLGRNNFIFMCISAAMIVIGFLLMLGGGSTAEAFNLDIFSVRRIVIGPTVAFLGFIALGISLIIRPRKKAAGKA